SYMTRRPRRATPLPYTTLFRSQESAADASIQRSSGQLVEALRQDVQPLLQLLVRHRERHQDADDVAVAAAGQQDQPLLPECFDRSEEHTSELQSRENLVCRLLL